MALQGKSLTSDPRRMFGDICVFEGHRCLESYGVLEHKSLENAWNEINDDLLWQCIDMFLRPEEVLRLRKAVRSIREVFNDSAKLQFVHEGRPGVVPDALIRTVQRRLVHAFYPTMREVAQNAGPRSTKFAKILLTRIEEDEWRAR